MAACVVGLVGMARYFAHQPRSGSIRVQSAVLAALHQAAAKGHLGVVETLVQAGVDLARALPTTGRNTLHTAAQAGQAHIVQYILTRPQPPGLEARDASGCTALWLACQAPFTALGSAPGASGTSRARAGDTAVLLMSKKASVHSRCGAMDASPLHWACLCGLLRPLQTLFDPDPADPTRLKCPAMLAELGGRAMAGVVGASTPPLELFYERAVADLFEAAEEVGKGALKHSGTCLPLILAVHAYP